MWSVAVDTLSGLAWGVKPSYVLVTIYGPEPLEELHIVQVAGSIAKMRCTALDARAHVRGGEYDRLEQVQVCVCNPLWQVFLWSGCALTPGCSGQCRSRCRHCLWHF